MAGARRDIPPGTLDMLILQTLACGVPMHGFEIADSIERVSGEVFHVEEGSLYPALQRILLKGWIAGQWGRTSENRRARYYTLSKAGRKQLQREVAQYDLAAAAIARILNPA
jgi:PadR family transcriptional regulator, regulatory protein PadR